MASSEKKRAREQNAAARRDRAVQKRAQKSAFPSGENGASSTDRDGTPAQSPEAARPEEQDA